MQRMMDGQYRNSDCGFLKDMVIHHDIAVAMAKDVFRHTKNPRILDLSLSIIQDQEIEIATMRQMQWSYCHRSMTATASVPSWLNQQFAIQCQNDCGWGPYQQVYHPLIRDKGFHLAMKRMDRLFTGKVATYTRDEWFLHDMIYHHQIAIEMAHHLQRTTQNPEMLVFLRKVIWNQSKEIWHMRMILRNYGDSFWMSHSDKLDQAQLTTYSYYLPKQTTSLNIEQDGCYL